jgi:pyruvyl transferase EpsO
VRGNDLKAPQPEAQGEISVTANLDLIESLYQQIDSVLEPLVPVGSACALIDYPYFPNVGDNAIWLGQWQYLRSRAAKVVYSCDHLTYSRESMAASINPETIILLQGGGNFGDLYPLHQQIRESVVADFPHNKIIAMPQSIYFRNPERRKQAKLILDAHPDLTILVRDRRSLELARQEFRNASALCPDMAFALGRLTRFAPKEEIFCLLRRDAEALGHSMPVKFESLSTADWYGERDSLQAFRQLLLGHRQWLRNWWQRSISCRELVYSLLAKQRLARGCRALSSGRVVITDRLHGHLLCLLMGIPHVVMDNSYGKLKDCYETWTGRSKLVQWADSPADALRAADSLAGSVGVHAN